MKAPLTFDEHLKEELKDTEFRRAYEQEKDKLRKELEKKEKGTKGGRGLA